MAIIATILIVLAGACSTVSVSISAPQSVAVSTATPFPLSYGSLGRVLTSDNWAGYVVSNNLPGQSLPRRQRPGQRPPSGIGNNPGSNSGVVSDVQAQWVVPTVTCGTADTYSAVWVGIDGETDGTVEQVGTGADCSKGQPDYYAWFEIFPRPSQDLSQFVVNPGDSVSADVQYGGAGVFNLTLQDLTTKQVFKVSRTNLRALRQSAEWVVEAPANQNNQVLPLADFSPTTFSQAQATINDQRCAIAQCAWSHSALVMENTSGKVRAYPSPLGTNGTSFSVDWHAS